MDVLHPAIWVSDLEEATHFLTDVLDLEEKDTTTIDGIEHAFLGGAHGELQLMSDPDSVPPEPDRATLDHVALSVEGTDELVDHVIQTTGYELLAGPMDAPTGARIAFVKGPDGYVFEFVDRD